MRLTLAFLMAAGAASCQSLLLDDFTTGPYTVAKKVAQPDEHYAPLPSGSPAGPARYTVFTIGTKTDYQQPNTLDIGGGHLIVDNGFGAIADVHVGYGLNLDKTPHPLHLNLRAYDRFRLRFAGGGAFYTITVYTMDGRHFTTSGSTEVRPSPFNSDI